MSITLDFLDREINEAYTLVDTNPILTMHAQGSYFTDSFDKERRVKRFNATGDTISRGYGYQFGNNGENPSPFKQFSSRGWKLHVAVGHNQETCLNDNERRLIEFIVANHLYAKVELKPNTYSNVLYQTGATIYLGHKAHAVLVAQLIYKELSDALQIGNHMRLPTTNGERILPTGSGSDRILSKDGKVVGRFDIARVSQSILSLFPTYEATLNWQDGLYLFADPVSNAGMIGYPIITSRHGIVHHIQTIARRQDLSENQKQQLIKSNNYQQSFCAAVTRSKKTLADQLSEGYTNMGFTCPFQIGGVFYVG